MTMTPTRKALLILLGIGTAEGVPMALLFAWSAPSHVARLYDLSRAGWQACVLAAATSAVYVTYTMRAFPLVREQLVKPSRLKLAGLVFAVMTGTMEEVWFRRQLMDAVLARHGGILLQIAVSAVLFGLVHAVWGLFARQWRVAAGAMLTTSVLGAALAGVYLLGSRAVAPCIWAHIAINAVIEPWLIISAVSRAGNWRAENTAVKA